jgi:hypothetical protein
MDVKTAYLYGNLTEAIYIDLPKGYENFGLPEGADPNNYCWKLNKSLYGLKQSGHVWNNEFDSWIKNMVPRPIKQQVSNNAGIISAVTTMSGPTHLEVNIPSSLPCM